MSKQVLLIDLYPEPCPEGKCQRIPALLHYYSPGDKIELHRVADLGQAEGIHRADVIVFRSSKGARTTDALGTMRKTWHSARILGVLCGWGLEQGDALTNIVEGLDDFLRCPFHESDLFLRIHRLLPCQTDGRDTADSGSQARHFNLLVGQSPCFLRAIDKVPLLAGSDATVLISGETGTGKDLVARAIHEQSPRRGQAFIPVNCGALPDHLCENELFGHAKGAFTDAASAEKGLVAEADGGTLYLDEVDALGASAQAKLLRFLHDREYRPLGSSKIVKADVRIIAASNRDLRSLVRANKLREDLYYRLNILSLSIPPLRERAEDIPLLANHFLSVYAAKYGRQACRLSPDALRKLKGYHLPGNVRELEAVIQRAVLLSSARVIEADEIDLPASGESSAITSVSLRKAKTHTVESFERMYLVDLMAAHMGNVSRAAKAAGKERRSFQRLLRKYGLYRSTFVDPL